MLETLGFGALATTGSGFAFTLGRLDGSVSLDGVEAHMPTVDAGDFSGLRAPTRVREWLAE